MSAPARTFSVRHIQLLRALFAAASALMITFSSDHSAAVGFAVFGGFVAASGFLLIVGAWIVASAGTRWPFILLAVIDLLAAMASSVPTWRTDGAFFIVVIVWAAASGLVELIAGLRGRRTDPTSKDAITIGTLGLVLAVVLVFIPSDYALQYSVDGAGALTLSGIILAVGMFGGYTAIVAVFLAIAGFSPNRPSSSGAASATDGVADSGASASESVESGGTA
ncbi:acyl-CoA synthetase [Microbacterium sp. A196]|uniref:acyl-CoA synthetase n=1 Tax=unclassified Microbacterium TaxID=2609290 RepID=UPI003FD0BF25